MTKARKKELGDWHENRSEVRDAAKMQLPPYEVRNKVDEYEREEQQLEVHGRLEKQPYP